MDKLQVLKIFIVAFSIYCNISAAVASAKKRHRRKFAKSSDKLTKIRPQQFGCYLACRKKRRDSCNDKDNKHERMEYHRTNDSQPQVYWSWRQGWRSACVSAAVCWVLPSALRSSWTASVGVVTWCWPVCTAELARRCLATAAATTTRREQVTACSSDSEMTHRCSHLPNKVQTINRTPDISLLYNGWGYPPPQKKIAPSFGGSGPYITHGSLGPP